MNQQKGMMVLITTIIVAILAAFFNLVVVPSYLRQVSETYSSDLRATTNMEVVENLAPLLREAYDAYNPTTSSCSPGRTAVTVGGGFFPLCFPTEASLSALAMCIPDPLNTTSDSWKYCVFADQILLGQQNRNHWLSLFLKTAWADGADSRANPDLVSQAGTIVLAGSQNGIPASQKIAMKCSTAATPGNVNCIRVLICRKNRLVSGRCDVSSPETIRQTYGFIRKM